MHFFAVSAYTFLPLTLFLAQNRCLPSELLAKPLAGVSCTRLPKRLADFGYDFVDFLDFLLRKTNSNGKR